ncbi:MAG: EAL domain-containing protein [Panacagrimonas sp.]
MGTLLIGDAPTSRYQHLLHELAAWRAGPLAALIYIDLRNLRDINRMAGVAEGDRVIRRVEQLLLQWGGHGTVSGRLWSDEFIIAKVIDHPDALTEDAIGLRDRLSTLRYESSMGQACIAVSIGASLYRQGADWERVVSEAQQASQHARRWGLNQVVRFGPVTGGGEDPGAGPQAVREFRASLKGKVLRLFAQPIMDIAGTAPRIAKAEFLTRMERGGHYMPLPAGVIEALERYGLASELDRFSTRFLLDWIDDHRDVLNRVHNLSINLSGASLIDAQFVDILYADVRSARLPAGKLCFEITETSAIQHLDVAAEVITAFKALGCRFSLDDFGAGLCSFGYLQTLPVDEVKIDGRFVRDIANNPVSQEIVRAIHHVAKVTGKKTVAEFVDDEAKLERLKRIGVDYAQGWLFSPAISPEKLLNLLKIG